MRSCMWDPLPVGVQGREKMRQLVESRKAEMSRILTELHHSGGRTVNKSCWCMTAEGKKSFIVLVLKLKPKWYWSIIRVKEDLLGFSCHRRAVRVCDQQACKNTSACSGSQTNVLFFCRHTELISSLISIHSCPSAGFQTLANQKCF